MPSFLNHNRNHTWPTGIHLIDFSFIKAPSEESLVNIDEDPFSHFISPLTEEDDPFDVLSLSAGILIPESPPSSPSQKLRASLAKRWARYISRSNNDLSEETYSEKNSSKSFSPVSWDDCSDPEDNERPRQPSNRAIVREPTRGRAQDLVGPINIRGKSHRATRTLSGHRHSWQQPSPDLFTVLEEVEMCDSGDEIAGDFEVVRDAGSRPSIRRKRSHYGQAIAKL